MWSSGGTSPGTTTQQRGGQKRGVLGGVRGQGNSWTVHGPDALVLVSLGSSKRDK